VPSGMTVPLVLLGMGRQSVLVGWAEIWHGQTVSLGTTVPT